MPRNDDELLAAYADGVAELSPEERRRVEALLDSSETMRDELASTRETIDQLRALPPVGEEPDWKALERSIRSAVADEPIKVRFWRTWQFRWLVPVFGMAVAAAAILIVMKTGSPDEPIAVAPPPAPIVKHVEPPAPAPAPVAADKVIIGGEAFDVGDLDLKALDDPEEAHDVVDGALLAEPDLHWMDHLDDKNLDRIEKVLQEGT